MPFLKSISLIQFKNYRAANFAFSERITGIFGPNGSGKTNLLDGIYYLCFTKSYFAGTDTQLVNRGMAGFRVSGLFADNGNTHEVTAVLRETGKKEISWDGAPYQRVSAHIGKLPAVVIAPDDVELITGGSEARRKLIDAMLCQLDETYLQDLMAYNKLLQQRNSMLKQMAENPAMSPALLEVYDAQLAAKGAAVYLRRRETVIPFLEKAAAHYRRIAGGDDGVSLYYQSQLSEAPNAAAAKDLFLQLLHRHLVRDRALQRTTAGIHRDDLQFDMMGQPFKQSASQGQRKSLLFALKLTEFEWLEAAKGFPPLLLLDDVFEKLDDHRMQNLLYEVCQEKQGQVFITDTHEERLKESLAKTGQPFAVIGL